MVDISTIDVFFCSVPGREEIAKQCLDAWRCTRGVLIQYLTPERISTNATSFQKLRRVYAEEKASGQYYVVADDDCLLPQTEWLESAIEMMDAHPEFSILSLWPVNAKINRWTPENYEAFEDADVMEHVSVGGIRICRKGMLPNGWPTLEGKAYDMAQCQAIRAVGHRVGYLKNHQMIHLGEGASSLK